MLKIKSAAKAKVLNVIVLSQKNRKPDDNPGAKLSFELQLPASMMAHFAAKMPGIFFEPAKTPPKQGELAGVPAATGGRCPDRRGHRRRSTGAGPARARCSP